MLIWAFLLVIGIIILQYLITINNSEQKYCERFPEDCECVEFNDMVVCSNENDARCPKEGKGYICDKWEKKNSCQLKLEKYKSLTYYTDEEALSSDCVCDEYDKELIYELICIPRYMGAKNTSMFITVKDDDELQVKIDDWWFSINHSFDNCSFMDTKFIQERDNKESCIKARPKILNDFTCEELEESYNEPCFFRPQNNARNDCKPKVDILKRMMELNCFEE